MAVVSVGASVDAVCARGVFNGFYNGVFGGTETDVSVGDFGAGAA